MRLLRDWGAERKYHHVLKGYNYRLDNLQGAILKVKLAHLEGWTRRRQEIAALYDARLDALEVPRPAASPQGDRHSYHVYAVRLRERERTRLHMLDSGVGVGMHYPIPVHLQPAFAALGHRAGDFPVTERFAEETLSLPIFPEITMDQLDHICAALSRACR
jgi:dTDP-4-amino-4,6-dideoxygalactose transaminase